jgi:hypothetical protein
MVRALGAVLLLVTVTTTARGEESTSPNAPPAPATLECAPPAHDPDALAEERAFSVELERFARLRAFTERLVAEREADAFGTSDPAPNALGQAQTPAHRA